MATVAAAAAAAAAAAPNSRNREASFSDVGVVAKRRTASDESD